MQHRWQVKIQPPPPTLPPLSLFFHSHQHSSNPPPTPNPRPAPSFYRALWSIEGESRSGLQIKAITLQLWRRKSGGRHVLASQTAILPLLSCVCVYTDIRFLPQPPPHPVLLLPPHSSLLNSSLSSAAARRWLIAFSNPHLSAWLKRPPSKRLAIQ